MPLLTTFSTGGFAGVGISSHTQVRSGKGKYFLGTPSNNQWSTLANWYLNSDNTGNAAELPDGSVAAILHYDCVANIDTWSEPFSIDQTTFHLTLNSSIGSSFSCAILGSGDLTLGGANYSNTVRLYGKYFSAATDSNWTTLGNWYLDSGLTTSANTLPRYTTSVILDSSCNVDMDSWIAPASINIQSHNIVFTSVIHRSLPCPVTGSGNVTLNGVTNPA